MQYLVFGKYKNAIMQLVLSKVLIGTFVLLGMIPNAFSEGRMATPTASETSKSSKACRYDAGKYSPVELNILGPDLSESGQLNTQLSLSEIRATARNRGAASADHVVAFADIEYGVAYEFSTRFYKIPKSSVECHWLERVNINFVFRKPPTVLIPSELEASRIEDGGVCFDQVFAHEMQHIYDYEKVFEDIVVHSEQDRRFHPINNFPTKNQTLEVDVSKGVLGNGDAIIKDMLTSHYEPIVAKTMREIKANIRELAEALDSTYEYQRITEYCRSVLRKIDGTAVK